MKFIETYPLYIFEDYDKLIKEDLTDLSKKELKGILKIEHIAFTKAHFFNSENLSREKVESNSKKYERDNILWFIADSDISIITEVLSLTQERMDFSPIIRYTNICKLLEIKDIKVFKDIRMNQSPINKNGILSLRKKKEYIIFYDYLSRELIYRAVIYDHVEELENYILKKTKDGKELVINLREKELKEIELTFYKILEGKKKIRNQEELFFDDEGVFYIQNRRLELPRELDVNDIKLNGIFEPYVDIKNKLDEIISNFNNSERQQVDKDIAINELIELKNKILYKTEKRLKEDLKRIYVKKNLFYIDLFTVGRYSFAELNKFNRSIELAKDGFNAFLQHKDEIFQIIDKGIFDIESL